MSYRWTIPQKPTELNGLLRSHEADLALSAARSSSAGAEPASALERRTAPSKTPDLSARGYSDSGEMGQFFQVVIVLFIVW